MGLYFKELIKKPVTFYSGMITIFDQSGRMRGDFQQPPSALARLCSPYQGGQIER